MLVIEVPGTTCPDCGGSLGYGTKDEGSKDKVLPCCMDCRKEFPSRFVESGDGFDERAENHVQTFSG